MVNDGKGMRQAKAKVIQTFVNKFSDQVAEKTPIVFHSALSKIFGFKFNQFLQNSVIQCNSKFPQ